MKKIGREVLFLKGEGNNPRNGEGAFLRLKDGGILYAFTEYDGNDWEDDASADIAGIYSYDEGETWGGRRILLHRDGGAANYMSVSLLRMQNGDLGMLYLRKDADTGSCVPYLVRSEDEGESWGVPVRLADDEGYYVVNNDRIVRLISGRLLVPVARHQIKIKFKSFGKGELNFFASDDDGKTWRLLLKEYIHILNEENSKTGLQEPGVWQFADGKIMAWSRTGFGSQFINYSEDDGESWTTPYPSEYFKSPVSPMQIKQAGQYTLAIWNPIPESVGREERGTWGRTPLVCAVSVDGGNTFSKVFFLEDDPENGYCYPAIFAADEYFLVAYYHSNNTGICLNSAKIVKVMYGELEQE